MTSLAYVAFTVAACVLGLGIGLILHFLRSFLRSNKSTQVAEDHSSLDLTGLVVAQKPWETISEWQRDANRSFAFHLGACGAFPALASIVAWSNRSDVVTTVCHSLQQVAVSSPLCS
jgi:hypothetical protein